MATNNTDANKTAMDKDAAARIQSAGGRDPRSDTATSGFDRRAQSTADQRAAQPTKADSKNGGK